MIQCMIPPQRPNSDVFLQIQYEYEWDHVHIVFFVWEWVPVLSSINSCCFLLFLLSSLPHSSSLFLFLVSVFKKISINWFIVSFLDEEEKRVREGREEREGGEREEREGERVCTCCCCLFSFLVWIWHPLHHECTFIALFSLHLVHILFPLFFYK